MKQSYLPALYLSLFYQQSYLSVFSFVL